jgi:S1-C subfamily serine protease
LRVLGVEPGGYAEEVGMTTGDVVLRIAGVPIYTRSDLWCVQYAHDPGAELAAEFARGADLLSGSGSLRANQPVG